MQQTTTSAEATEYAATEFLTYIQERPGVQGTATVVGLSGELGAGKTTFMKGIARAFGLEEDITSPTFVIQKMYDIQNEQFDLLVHIDAYRLESGEEMGALGWHEMITNPRTIVFLEWPEKVSSALPLRTEMVHFEVLDTNERSITYGSDYKEEKDEEDPIGY